MDADRTRRTARGGGRGAIACGRASPAWLVAALAVLLASSCARPRPTPAPPAPPPTVAVPAPPASLPAPSPAAPPRLAHEAGQPCGPSCTPEEHLTGELDALLATPALQPAIVSVKVQSLDTSDLLYELNPDTLVVPASNMKIVTMAVAAERLGWDFRFETRLESVAPIENGVLRGDLVVVGGGDPSMNARGGADRDAAFAELAAGLRQAGVARVEGRLVGDGRAFAGERWGFGWSWDDFAYGYQAPVSALQYNENLVQVLLRPGTRPGEPAIVELRPQGSGLTLVNRSVTGERGTSTTVDLFRFPGRTELEVRGSIPIASGEITRDAAVPDPTSFFLGALRAALANHGIEVTGRVVDLEALAAGATAGAAASRERDAIGRSAPSGSDTRAGDAGLEGTGSSRVLARRLSAPLSEIGRTLMKVSQNLYAETVFRALSLAPGPASVEASQKVQEEVLSGWGIAPGQYALADGSGLSRHNLLTSSAVLRILQVMARTPSLAEAFEATLPVAGRDGTIAGRLKATRGEGNVKAKTGTLMRVRALSGYLSTLDGERLAFSIIANHYTAPTRTIDAVVDQVLERLANFSRRRTSR